ncbi:MAG: triphosphoribosyl-dephospho-CoA synthase [Propionibacteriaceae bacterium]|nr:triphosphoribosyl-dephospho-CoA synthase [Propionibacteriaceae bacterium]
MNRRLAFEAFSPGQLGRLATKALVVEACLTPKPGLVDAHDSGAHRDMNLTLLLRSAQTLEPWYARCAEIGAVPGYSTASLRQVGRDAETAMLAATGGVNTHKGAIFALGWLCAAGAAETADSGPDPDPGLAGPAGRRALVAAGPEGGCSLVATAEPFFGLAAGRSTPKASATSESPFGLAAGRSSAAAVGSFATAAEHPLVVRLCGHVAKRVLEPEAAPGPVKPAAAGASLSHGQQAWREYGLPGARGEAAGGFATVRRHGLPAWQGALERGWDSEDALLAALIALMAHNGDTNLVARGGLAALRRVQTWAAALEAQLAEITPAALWDAAAAANRWFSSDRLSPGGSADLLAVTWFLGKVAQIPPATCKRPGRP